jgi:hypothetical protein
MKKRKRNLFSNIPHTSPLTLFFPFLLDLCSISTYKALSLLSEEELHFHIEIEALMSFS